MDPGYDPDPYPYWHSSQATAEGLNVAGYANPDIDRLLERARMTVSLEERKRAYAEFQAKFAEEAPSVVLYHPMYAYAQNRRLRGVDAGPLYDTSSRFSNVREWYTETQRIFGP
jgi:peptide/nickel transport system substrate-binding protein